MYIDIRPQTIHQWLAVELIQKRLILKEFSIIKSWQQQGWLPNNCLEGQLSLFRTHFFVFHQLYHFKKHILTANTGDLSIHALEIRYEPTSIEPTSINTKSIDKTRNNAQSRETVSQLECNTSLSHLDSLMHYYLDWRPFFETTHEEVTILLRFATFGISEPYRLQSAFQRFELAPPTSAQSIKARYRKLVQKHHPDKGGDPALIQTINQDRTLLMQWLQYQ